ncbi:MAG: PDZ domain-containing protein [Paludibacteraceae bacterium]|nr:PDZ domain-containing protein [Paludibacteraceae bacterium]MBR0065590.1 PDZ domain-containing protein [Paludibacteraceae bacterium]
MKKYILPTLTVIAVTLGIVIGVTLSQKANAQRIIYQNGQWHLEQTKVDRLLQLMENAYVDSINVDSITDEVMTEIVQKLDPHSAYIPKEDLEMVNSELAGSFSGIGVQFTIQQDTVRIVAVISGGPSEGMGVLAGDKLISVDDSAFVGKKMNNEKVMRTLRGAKGTKVKLGVLRAGSPETLYFTVTRGDIPVHSVDAKFLIESDKATKDKGKKIGFIRVNKFGETTYREFISALADLYAKGATRFIIDLRENSGGYMEQAIRMANEFLQRGDMIVYSEGRAYPRYEATANGTGRFKNTPLVVLIDDFSASASEIFAGAMQDNDRATIIGRRSFGKGLVQQQLPFDDGSAIRLTVARYYTPSGRCIQKPYTLGDQTDYQQELMTRFEHGEFYSADSVHFADTTVYYTKSGRKMYGGGGIMPDVFVGRDTTLNTPWFNRCVNLAYTYQFAYQYTDKHRKELSRYKDWQSLELYLLKQDVIRDFAAYAEEKGVEKNEAEIQKSRPLMTRLLNAYIVRNMLGDEGFFPLFERDDEITKKAVDYLTTTK